MNLSNLGPAFLATCPAPLTPPECDLRDFDYMPVYINRLRKSRTWIKARYNPELGFRAMNLWLEAWNSCPAGSLEADDVTLAEAAMCDPTRWAEIRDEIMASWVLCSDGRYYHPVVAACAMDAWRKRERYRRTLSVARDVKATKAARKEEERQHKLWKDEVGRTGRAPVSQAAAYTAAMAADCFELSASPPGLSARSAGLSADQGGSSAEGPELSADLGAFSSHNIDAADNGAGTTAAEAVASPAEALTPPDVANGEASRISANSSVIGLKSEVRSLKKKEGSLRSPRTHAQRARGERVCDDPDFDTFISKYPVPMFPRFARMEWDGAIERGASPGEILRGLEAHRFPDNHRFVPHPAKWLAGECWRTAGDDGFDPVLRAVGLTPADFAGEPMAAAMLLQ